MDRHREQARRAAQTYPARSAYDNGLGAGCREYDRWDTKLLRAAVKRLSRLVKKHVVLVRQSIYPHCQARPWPFCQLGRRQFGLESIRQFGTLDTLFPSAIIIVPKPVFRMFVPSRGGFFQPRAGNYTILRDASAFRI